MKFTCFFFLVTISMELNADVIRAAKVFCFPEVGLFEVTNFILQGVYYGNVSEEKLNSRGVFTDLSRASKECVLGDVKFSLRPFGPPKKGAYSYSLYADESLLIKNGLFIYSDGYKASTVRATGGGSHNPNIELEYRANKATSNRYDMYRYSWSVSQLKNGEPIYLPEYQIK